MHVCAQLTGCCDYRTVPTKEFKLLDTANMRYGPRPYTVRSTALLVTQLSETLRGVAADPSESLLNVTDQHLVGVPSHRRFAIDNCSPS